MILLLLACNQEQPTVIAGVDAPLTVTLVNPTTCSFCDPFLGVDTLRVDVLAGDTVVASQSFSPLDDLLLPGLLDFGVVRVQLVGLSAGVVVSAGRTQEVALDPGSPRDVPMLFLPANTVIPLPAEMTADRSRHVAVRRRDGRVMLFGGVDPSREGTFSSIDLFDPATWSFGVFPGALPAGLADPAVAWTGTDELLLAGGFVTGPSGDVPTATTAAWSQVDDTVRALPPLSVTREDACLAMYRDRLGLVLGGTDETDAGSLVKLDETTEDWSFVDVKLRDFDQTQVSACLGLGDGRVFLQGDDPASTGTWSYDEGDTDAGLGFVPVDLLGEGADRFVHLPLVAQEAGGAWVAGGMDTNTGTAISDTRWFDPARNGFLPMTPLADARLDPSWDRWLVEGWYVVGCGWRDGARLSPTDSVELVSPGEGLGTPATPFDRDRNGCAVTTLLDGSILVTGGYDATDDGVIDAAVMVPWIE
jgi:hypothetical protein